MIPSLNYFIRKDSSTIWFYASPLSKFIGRIPLESLAGMKWNHWPESCGIGGRNEMEYTDGNARVLVRVQTDQSGDVEFHLDSTKTKSKFENLTMTKRAIINNNPISDNNHIPIIYFLNIFFLDFVGVFLTDAIL